MFCLSNFYHLTGCSRANRPFEPDQGCHEFAGVLRDSVAQNSRMYLAAYAQHFGATGLTFFDDEVIEFFSPHAAGKEVIFLMALGRPDLVRIGRQF